MNTKLILAALMMSLSLAACGQKEEAAPEATTEPAPPADTAPMETPPAETAPMEGTTPEGTTPPADTTTPPAEGDAAEPAPAQ
jgi:PBP1b-binding outer membrane lipoprotein LpoB